jgi:hemerythrin-like domain-containing protein
MDAIEMLMSEHRLIEQALVALEAYAEDVVQGRDVDAADLENFVTFIREFADEKHHGKEEDILFAEMVKAGFPSEAGPIAVMLSDHEQGRGFVRVLAALTEKARWTIEDRKELAAAAFGYVGLLRQHIQKEDHVLYPMARARLPAEVLAEVDARAAAFEAEQTQSGTHDRLVSLGQKLLRRHTSVAAA